VTRRLEHPTLLIATTVGCIVALAALLARIGADSQWLAALGHVIVAHDAVPSGVPFAAAPTAHWPNVLVLAELIFNGLQSSLGDRGLMLGQLAAVAVAFTVLARDARAGGASAAGAAGALLLVAVGALPSLAIVRLQMFSLALFPVLLLLLRAEVRRPSRRIWLAVPLLALWSNLHGAALLGLVVVLAYLLLVRLRTDPRVACGVGVAAVLALCLTPALARTVPYYQGVLTNVAAERGQGMWGPLSLSSPLDLILIAGALALSVRAWRARPQLWECAVIVALGLATIQASRNGVWLLFFLAAPAARGARASVPRWVSAMPAAAVVSIAVIAFAAVRGPAAEGAGKALVTRAIALAHGTPVLADGGIDEQLALAGGRLWVGNPIDAFSRGDQGTYLSWLAGQPAGGEALTRVRIVLVSRGSRAQALTEHTPGFTLVASDRRSALYERGSGTVMAALR
jgi:hypothetical protein